MYKEMMYWCGFCLFKVGYNQLINKLSFMSNCCFVLAVSRIKKQSREQACKQSADDIKCWYICDFLSLPKSYTYNSKLAQCLGSLLSPHIPSNYDTSDQRQFYSHRRNQTAEHIW